MKTKRKLSLEVEHAEPRLTAPTLFTVALLAAVGPLGIDLYLVAFPQIAADLATSIGTVQLSLTTFLVGSGAGQLVFGPLSDRLGRRRSLFVGLVLLLGGSLWAMMAPDIISLVLARALQGLGAASGMVIGRAIVADRTSGRDTARAMNLVMLMIGLAPVVAPVLGALLDPILGWRGLLGVVLGLAIIALVLVACTVDADTRSDFPRRRPERTHWVDRRVFLGYVLGYALGMSALLAYVAASPFVYQQVLRFTAMQYGIAFAITAALLSLATWISSRLTATMNPSTVASIGLGISATFGIAASTWLVCGGSPAVLVIIFPLIIAPLGLVLGNAAALAMNSVPLAVVGLGSAILGAAQFVFSGIASALAGIGESVLSVLIVVGASSAIAFALIVVTAGALRGRIQEAN